MKNLVLFKTVIGFAFLSFSCLHAQISGTFLIEGGSPTTTLGYFLNNTLYPNGINGNTILELADGYNEEEYVRIQSYEGNDQYTLTIRPESGAQNCTLLDNSNNNSVISFENARNVTLDGRPGGTGAENVLTVIQRQNNFENAIRFGWSTTSKDTSVNVTIRNCDIQSNGSDVILYYYADNTIIEHCDVSTYTINEQSSDRNLTGINMGSVSRSTIRNNRIHNLKTLNPMAIAAIECRGSSEQTGSTRIYNNFISMDMTVQDSLARVHGIRARWSSLDTCKIYHNSIYIGGYQAAYQYVRDSYGILQDRSGVLEIKNNLVVNERRGVYSHYAIYVDNTEGYNEFDYNTYYVDKDNSGILGRWGTSDASSMSNWRSFSGQDANSTEKRVWYVNTGENDLHLSGSSFVDEDLQAPVFGGLTLDIDGEIRSITMPFKGADEPSAELMVISPNGEEVFEPGQQVTITWHDEISENVSIDLYKSGSFHRQIAGTTESDGIYEWSVFTDLVLSDDYQIRIGSTSGGVYDESDLYFSLSDLTAPEAPSNLTAGGTSPSPWQNTSSYTLSWTNPADISGISEVRYKIGAAPTSNSDFTGTLPGSPPQTVTHTDQGVTRLYLWLVDGSGNEDFKNNAYVDLRYDTLIGAPSNFSENHGVQDDTWTRTTSNPTFRWAAPADESGIAEYHMYFGPNQLATTAVDTTTSLSWTTPAPEGISYLRIRAKDNAGNIGSWVTGFIFKLDHSAPSNPNDVAETGGSEDNHWQNSVTDPNFNWSGAEDMYSGVAQYYVYWGNDPAGQTSTVSTSPAYKPSTSSNGTYYLRISTQDAVGNRSQDATLFTFKHDGDPPVNPTTFSDISGGSVNDVWQNSSSSPEFEWDAAVDLLSGIKHYLIYWGTDSLGTSVETTTLESFIPAAPDTGMYHLRLSSVDSADNAAGWKTGYTFKYDNVLPQVAAVSIDTSSEVTFQVRWDGGRDFGGSGLSGQYHVKVKDGEGGWTDWLTNHEGTSARYSGEHGHSYSFEAAALDNAGNIEKFTGAAECMTVVDTTVKDLDAPDPPVNLTAEGGFPNSPWKNSSNFMLNWTNPDDRSGITGMYYKLDSSPSSAYDTSGSFTDGPPVNIVATKQNGQPVYIWLEDGSGNVNHLNAASVNLRWDAEPPSGTMASSPQTSSSTSFQVSWGGGSDGSGSGMSGIFDVNVSNDGMTWSTWKRAFMGSGDMYTGQDGMIYYFEAAGHDSAGNVEAFTGVAECSTLVQISGDITPPAAPLNVTVQPSGWTNQNSFTLNWTNPEDNSTIAGVYYRIGTAPSSNEDGIYVEGSNVMLTGLDVPSAGVHDIYIWLRDTAGNRDYRNHERATLWFDDVKPGIQHTVVTTELIDRDITISAAFSEEHSGLEHSNLLYRKTGDISTPASVDLSNGQASIPAALNTQRGVEYAISAEDSAGNPSRLPETGFFPIQIELSGEGAFERDPNGQAVVRHQGQEAADYRIFSVPFELNDKRPSAVFEDDLGPFDDTQWKLFDVSGNSLRGYESIRNLNIVTPGKAFLLLVNKPDIVLDTGSGMSPRMGDYLELPLVQGWNLVGNPFDYDIPAENLNINGVQPEIWHAGSGGWTRTNVTHLKKWGGLAVFSDEAGQLNLGVGSGTALKETIPKTHCPDLWNIKIEAISETGQDLDNFIGLYDPKDIATRIAWHEPPRLNGGIGLAIIEKNQSNDLVADHLSQVWSTLLKPLDGEGYEWQLRINSDKAGENIQLRFLQINGSLPSSYHMKLIDKDLKLLHDLDDPEWKIDCRMSVSGERNFLILIGTDDYLDKRLDELKIAPDRFELKQNFPNPFNASTRIIFGLPRSEIVKLDIFNVLGEKVVTLVNNRMREAGYHVITWDGRNKAGKPMASGVYIFRFSAGKQTQLRKAMLIK